MDRYISSLHSPGGSQSENLATHAGRFRRGAFAPIRPSGAHEFPGQRRAPSHFAGASAADTAADMVGARRRGGFAPRTGRFGPIRSQTASARQRLHASDGRHHFHHRPPYGRPSLRAVLDHSFESAFGAGVWISVFSGDCRRTRAELSRRLLIGGKFRRERPDHDQTLCVLAPRPSRRLVRLRLAKA